MPPGLGNAIDQKFPDFSGKFNELCLAQRVEVSR